METIGNVTRQRERFRKNHFEQEAWAQKRLVCGIDEVGRGCFAGPVVAGAVILPVGKAPAHLKDSKIMTAEEREKAARWIEKHCWYGIGIAHNRLIEQHNIWHATLIAMKRALVNLLSYASERPAHILIDAMPLQLFDTSYHDIPVSYFPFGEKKSSSIAAASIIAKVRRDALMGRMDAVFPGYSLADHKGYGTPAHRRILRESGNKLLIHRAQYIKHIHTMEVSDDFENQHTIASCEPESDTGITL